MSDPDLWCAERRLPDPTESVRRYCGLEWSGGPPETWAFRYFDLIPGSHLDRVEPVDVVACAALHSGLSHQDLVYFDRSGDDFESWLAKLPADVDLADADEATLNVVGGLHRLTDPVGLSLLSKVAHRKRPRLVPMLDRAVGDCYRPLIGERGERAWPGLISALHRDLGDSRNRPVLDSLATSVQLEVGASVPSALRVLDIAIWMGARK